jgi:hypothetical protein
VDPWALPAPRLYRVLVTLLIRWRGMEEGLAEAYKTTRIELLRMSQKPETETFDELESPFSSLRHGPLGVVEG